MAQGSSVHLLGQSSATIKQHTMPFDVLGLRRCECIDLAALEQGAVVKVVNQSLALCAVAVPTSPVVENGLSSRNTMNMIYWCIAMPTFTLCVVIAKQLWQMYRQKPCTHELYKLHARLEERTRISMGARSKQRQVQKAISNYAYFHGLPTRAVTVGHVERTSAGISGWAQAQLHNGSELFSSEKASPQTILAAMHATQQVCSHQTIPQMLNSPQGVALGTMLPGLASLRPPLLLSPSVPEPSFPERGLCRMQTNRLPPALPPILGQRGQRTGSPAPHPSATAPTIMAPLPMSQTPLPGSIPCLPVATSRLCESARADADVAMSLLQSHPESAEIIIDSDGKLDGVGFDDLNTLEGCDTWVNLPRCISEGSDMAAGLHFSDGDSWLIV